MLLSSFKSTVLGARQTERLEKATNKKTNKINKEKKKRDLRSFV